MGGTGGRPGRFLAVGDTAEGDAAVWSSDDGVAWPASPDMLPDDGLASPVAIAVGPPGVIVLGQWSNGVNLRMVAWRSDTSVDVRVLQRTVIMKGDAPGREAMWVVTPGAYAEVRSTQKRFQSFARHPSLIYSERFNDPASRNRGFGTVLDYTWSRCAEASWLFGIREWGPSTISDATSRYRAQGYCHAYSARAMGYADRWNARGWYERVATRWPRYFHSGDVEDRFLRWR